jgi:cell division protein FtsA
MKAKFSHFVALDLGSSKIAGLIAYFERKGEVKIIDQILFHSQGFKSGNIIDFNLAESSVINAVYEMEKQYGKNIKQVAISISGANTKSYYITHKIKLPGQQVTKDDVRRLIQKSLLEFTLKDQEIIHYFPVEFVIDSNHSVENPVGIFGKELTCQLHIIAADYTLIQNLIGCFAKCQIEIIDISLGVYASALACLTEDEKNLGAVIIDIGANTTSFGVFLSGKLLYSSYIPIGGANITYDIAKVFSLSFAAAEKLKVLYGNAQISQFDKDNLINLENIENNDHYNSIPVITTSALSQVIHSRIEEIFLMIKAEYDKTGLEPLIARRMVISGGGSMLRGIKETASTIFEKQIRIGKPIMIPGFIEDYNPGMYASVLGVIKNHIAKQQKFSFNDNTPITENRIFSKIISWFKENL